MNLQDGSENIRIISSRSQLKSDWSIRNVGINRSVKNCLIILSFNLYRITTLKALLIRTLYMSCHVCLCSCTSIKLSVPGDFAPGDHRGARPKVLQNFAGPFRTLKLRSFKLIKKNKAVWPHLSMSQVLYIAN